MFEYECVHCGKELEFKREISDEAEPVCGLECMGGLLMEDQDG